MHDQRSCRRVQAAASEREDRERQRVVLIHLLAEYPIQLTKDDLLRTLCRNASDFGERDAVKRAIRELAAVDLLRRNGSVVLPSPAAFRAYELWEG